MPIAVSPPIDGLFDIAHDEESVSGTGKNVHQQSPDDAPLQPAGVLKLIHQHVVVADTGFLQDELRIAVSQRLTQRPCRLGEQRTVSLREVALDEVLQRTHQLHVSAEPDGQRQGVIPPSQRLSDRRCLPHQLVAAVFLAHAAETILRRHFLRRLDRPNQALVRGFRIAVIALCIRLALG